MELSAQRVGSRIYIVGNTYNVKETLKSELKPTWDGERKQWWVGLSKAKKAEVLVAKLNGGEVVPEQANPDKVRLTGKCKYKGRTYYMGAKTNDGQRVRLFSLPGDDGKYIEFWANVSECDVLKIYKPRTQTYYGRTETIYTTLGSIADFIAENLS